MSGFRQAFVRRLYPGRFGRWLRAAMLAGILLWLIAVFVESSGTGLVASGSAPTLILAGGLLAQVLSDSFQERALPVAVGLRVVGVFLPVGGMLWLVFTGDVPLLVTVLVFLTVSAILFLVYAHQKDARDRRDDGA